jgi:hypothetical protein
MVAIVIRRQIKGHIRFSLRWHARLPFLTPLVLCLVFSLPVVFSLLVGDLIWEITGGGLLGIEYLLSVICFLFFVPAVYSCFALLIEDIWMVFGLYSLFGIQPHRVRNQLRSWSGLNGEGTMV